MKNYADFKKGIVSTITALIIGGLAVLVGALIGEITNTPSAKTGAAPQPIAGQPYSLAGSGISASATSITLSSLTITQTGQKITTSDLRGGSGDVFYITIEPGNRSKQEVVSCSAVTQNPSGSATLTGCTRGLSPVFPYAASTTLGFVHGGGSQVIFSNPPNLYRQIIDYIDNATSTGAVDAGIITKGVMEVATGAEAGSTTPIGSGNTTAPLALTTIISTSTCQSTGNYAVITDNNGKINANCLGTLSNLTITGSSTLQSTTTIQGVNVFDAFKHMQVFTASSTWTVPATTTLVFAEMVGGGGGARGTPAGASRAGAGAGAYCADIYTVTPGSSQTVVVGFGNYGGAAGDTAGQDGTASTFGDCSAGGGASAQTGGTATGGMLNITGGSGKQPIYIGATTPDYCLSGSGGDSHFGNGGSSVVDDNGQPGTGYGGGGSGGCDSSGGAARTGGKGSNGVVILRW